MLLGLQLEGGEIGCQVSEGEGREHFFCKFVHENHKLLCWSLRVMGSSSSCIASGLILLGLKLEG